MEQVKASCTFCNALSGRLRAVHRDSSADLHVRARRLPENNPQAPVLDIRVQSICLLGGRLDSCCDQVCVHNGRNETT